MSSSRLETSSKGDPPSSDMGLGTDEVSVQLEPDVISPSGVVDVVDSAVDSAPGDTAALLPLPPLPLPLLSSSCKCLSDLELVEAVGLAANANAMLLGDFS